MGIWRCNECGGEIVAGIKLKNYEKKIKKDGSISKTIEDIEFDGYFCIKRCLYSEAQNFEELKAIAYYDEE